MKKNILVTGGAGFIGSHLVNKLVVKYSDYRIINLDVLTSASSLKNIHDIDGYSNYIFEKVDIRNKKSISEILHKLLDSSLAIIIPFDPIPIKTISFSSQLFS